jgi:transposase
MAPSPVLIVLTLGEESELRGLLRPTAECRMRERAEIVLAAAGGGGNQEIAGGVGVSRNTVSKWRGRYAQKRLAGLEDLPRSGRPKKFTSAQKAQVVAIACSKPADKDVPLAFWSAREIARRAAAEGAVESISASQVLRWLKQDLLKPWQVESWISPRDPDFAAKAGAVPDLYQRVWQGVELVSHAVSSSHNMV